MTAGCAICGKPVDPQYRPFCSKRCSDIDLHRWLSGVYLVPGQEGEAAGRQEEPLDEEGEGE